jgi:23S rRNA (cytosine1962-C5)-methyltransferase
MPDDVDRANGTGYELLDAGEGRRLERFGALTVDRSAPAAVDWRRAPDAWAAADLQFEPGPGWVASSEPGRAALAASSATGRSHAATAWRLSIAGLTMELRPTGSGGVGLYPEHAATLAWLERGVGGWDPEATGRARPEVLNLFAHTGLATLALARSGAAVAHVDGARSAISWARRNAELSGLDDRPIRWLVDDVGAFVAREARRGRRYDGIVLDPPSFGHAARRAWRLEDDLPALLASCRAVAADDAFVLLTAHSESLDGAALGDYLRRGFGEWRRPVETTSLELIAASGAVLPLGWAARLRSTRSTRAARSTRSTRSTRSISAP